jgi:hypothetical protein
MTNRLSGKTHTYLDDARAAVARSRARKNSLKKGNTMARNSIQKHVMRHQTITFADWYAELRELAGERWFEVAEQAPTAFAIWSGGGTAAQALFMISSILPKQQAA